MTVSPVHCFVLAKNVLIWHGSLAPSTREWCCFCCFSLLFSFFSFFFLNTCKEAVEEKADRIHHSFIARCSFMPFKKQETKLRGRTLSIDKHMRSPSTIETAHVTSELPLYKVLLIKVTVLIKAVIKKPSSTK